MQGMCARRCATSANESALSVRCSTSDGEHGSCVHSHHKGTHAPVRRACFRVPSAPTASEVRLLTAAPRADRRADAPRVPLGVADFAAPAPPLCAVLVSRAAAAPGAWLAWNSGSGAAPDSALTIGSVKPEAAPMCTRPCWLTPEDSLDAVWSEVGGSATRSGLTGRVRVAEGWAGAAKGWWDAVACCARWPDEARLTGSRLDIPREVWRACSCHGIAQGGGGAACDVMRRTRRALEKEVEAGFKGNSCHPRRAVGRTADDL